MDTLVLFGIFALIGIFVVAAVFIGYVQERKRTEQWQQIAQQLGLPFLGEREDLLPRFGSMRIFQRGSDRGIRNVVAGEMGPVRVTLGDFRYTTGSGKNRRTHQFTVCIVENDALRVPACYLRPERRLLDALGSLFGGQDIDFEEDDEFSRSFVLQGESEADVRALFTAEVRAWFCANPLANLQFEARDNALALHLARRMPPDEVVQLLQHALEITKVLGHQNR
jgi:hypothetical protein